jgi:DNA-binding response OmpR family regulator
MAAPKGLILCTENDADTRDLIDLILTREGYQVVCTEETNLAVDLARSQVFDLYLVDNWMPGLSGTQLTEQLREFDVKTPVLFYSAAAFQSDKDAAFLSGAQGYLVKPALADDLIAEVVRLIAESKIAIPVAMVAPDDTA